MTGGEFEVFRFAGGGDIGDFFFTETGFGNGVVEGLAREAMLVALADFLDAPGEPFDLALATVFDIEDDRLDGASADVDTCCDRHALAPLRSAIERPAGEGRGAKRAGVNRCRVDIDCHVAVIFLDHFLKLAHRGLVVGDAAGERELIRDAARA